MEKVINYFKENFKSELLNQKIRVYGWQYEYEHNLVSSICGYLFEEFKTIEEFASLTGVGKTLIELLKETGVLKGIPETNQLTLF